MAELRKYQEVPARQLLRALRMKKKHITLGAAVGSGKTLMAALQLKQWWRPGKRILVFAENQTLLRDQFGGVLREVFGAQAVNIVGHVDGPRAEPYNPEAPVVCAIPASFRLVEKPGKFDVIVYDEAHRYTLAKMHRALRRRVAAQRTQFVYLSATFHRLREDREIRDHGVEIALGMDTMMAADKRSLACPESVLMGAYPRVDYRDYNEQKELKGHTPLPTRETLQVVRTIARQAKRKGLRGQILWQAHNDVNGHTRDIVAAIQRYFPGDEVEVSTARVDGMTAQLQRFQTDATLRHCVVVGRGTLGFNMPHLQGLVDMSCSLNPESRAQRYGRITRPHPKGHKKFEWVVVPKDRLDAARVMTHLAYYLCVTEGLTGVKKGWMHHKIYRAVRTKARSGKPGERQVSKVPILPRNPMDLWEANERWTKTGKAVKVGGVKCVVMTREEVGRAMGLARIPDPLGRQVLLKQWIKTHGYLPTRQSGLSPTAFIHPEMCTNVPTFQQARTLSRFRELQAYCSRHERMPASGTVLYTYVLRQRRTPSLPAQQRKEFEILWRTYRKRKVRATDCPHTRRPHHALGVCRSCYTNRRRHNRKRSK